MKKIIGILVMVCFGISITFAKSRDLPGITIVSRAQRGANEVLRYTTTSYQERKDKTQLQREQELDLLMDTDVDAYFKKQQSLYQTEARNDYLTTYLPKDQVIDDAIYQIGNNFLKRPQRYHEQKTRIIIHHTAGEAKEFTGKDGVKAYLQDMYKFHTLTRGRGDLGYNFVIDPFGTIYEGRAGGENVVGAHASRNNIASIGIALIGNFEVQNPTPEQRESLTRLATALAKKYHIDPFSSAAYNIATTEEPYLKTVKHESLAGHKDAGITSCPGKNLYALLPQIRSDIIDRLSRGVLVSNTATGSASTDTSKEDKSKEAISKDVSQKRLAYYKKNKITPKIPADTTKIKEKISLEQAKLWMQKNISVLLYDVSKNYTTRSFTCTSGCQVTGDEGVFTAKNLTVEIAEGGFMIQTDAKSFVSKSIRISALQSGGVVTIMNYSRKSYNKIPRNTFYGEIMITQDNGVAIINTLPFQKYLLGIAESSDSESPEKIKTIALLAKMYGLFYITGKNPHPSIPSGAKYQAIDNPDMFQKYVGAGREKTSKKIPALVKSMMNTLVMYKGNVPILPYFSCSAGFTRSAKEKRGRTDTPYLASRIDLSYCPSFAGHGVGLSGKGAQYFATKGRKTKDIIQYYYPGVEMMSF